MITLRRITLNKFYKIIFKSFHNFYKHVLGSHEPYAMSVFGLAVSTSIFILYFIDFVSVMITCKMILTKGLMLAIVLPNMIFHIIYFYQVNLRTRNWNKINFKTENRKIENVLGLVYFLLSTSLLFWFTDFLYFLIELRC